MADKPLWRRTFDSVDHRIARPIEAAARSDAFGDVLTVALRLRGRAQREVEKRTRRALHLVNLPAATDVRQLSEQVAALRREVRDLEDRGR
jgi:polyhydroxyalkanoate synthesis regulator phasin